MPLTPKSEQKELHLLTYNTPNGIRVQVALEELKAIYKFEFSYEIIDLIAGAQRSDDYTKLNPNSKIPCLVDNKNPSLYNPSSPFVVIESSAILMYLSKSYDKDNIFGFNDELESSELFQWLLFGMTNLSPATSQLFFFTYFAPEKPPYAIKRFHDEILRLYGVLESHLSGKHTGAKKSYLAGKGEGKYSWADITIWPTVGWHKKVHITDEEMAEFPSLQAWHERIGERPAAKEGSGPKYDLKK